MLQQKRTMLFLALGLGFTYVWWYFSEPSTTRAMSDRLAFTVVQITEAFGKNGRQDLSETKVSAQKADGSQAFQVNRSFQHETIGHDAIEFRNVFDVTLRKHYGIDPLTRSVTTRSLREQKTNQMASKPSCETPSSNSEVVLGYPVSKTIEQRQLHGNHRVMIERWLAPDLECFPLQIVVQKFESGIGVAQTTTRTLLVNLGDPDLSLFHIPSDYVERSPSQVMAEHVRMGKTNFNSALAQTADRSYYANQ